MNVLELRKTNTKVKKKNKVRLKKEDIVCEPEDISIGITELENLT